MNPRERFCAACRREPVDQPPVWLMRQAGRYLPEYQDIRKEYSFFELARDTHLINRVSLMPWKRFGVDGVIIFSDILMPVVPMGLRLSFEEGRGPRFDVSVRDAGDVARLKTPCVEDDLWFVLSSLTELKERLHDDAALIGFVGAPWTVAAYMMEGGSSDFAWASARVRERAPFAMDLLARITDMTASYAAAQVRAGADVVQIFDTWAGIFEPAFYADVVLPHVQRIVTSIHKAGGIASLFMKPNTSGTFPRGERPPCVSYLDSGADVASIGSSVSLAEAFDMLGDRMAIQGNLDHEILLSSKDDVVAHTKKLIAAVRGRPGWIANLGHGVLPATPIENVEAFIDAVRSAD